MPDFQTPNEIPQTPPVDCSLSLAAMERILAESTLTMENMKAEFGFLWSMTDKGSALRPTVDGLKDREVKLRKMIVYVAHIQKRVDDAKAAIAAIETIAENDPFALESDDGVEAEQADGVS